MEAGIHVRDIFCSLTHVEAPCRSGPDVLHEFPPGFARAAGHFLLFIYDSYRLDGAPPRLSYGDIPDYGVAPCLLFSVQGSRSHTVWRHLGPVIRNTNLGFHGSYINPHYLAHVEK